MKHKMCSNGMRVSYPNQHDHYTHTHAIIFAIGCCRYPIVVSEIDSQIVIRLVNLEIRSHLPWLVRNYG